MHVYLMYILFSLFISIYDIKTGMVSRFLLWGALLFFFIVKCFLSGGFFEAATGGALGILVFLVVFFISRKRLGLADVWYAGLAGIVLGPLWWYPAMALSCLFGILVTVVFRRRVIPFIPCMAAGSGVILSYTFWSK